ncbi:hypothetical protein STIV2_C86 [Sulfolobus turreted icosahedral virus 2]|uniref:Uncharacterized protein n=1 Tax=Sulfolobus turreted icosahedral virus 2 TaxID=754004 RepID=D5IEX5_9VIRU|nr:hypothetical protein STIV2_C86 [Sulfolobus turreted icosahedral virus 2]ADF27750.1 hypothetical protein STIV2_C86 [Sulfolobus turreted icosahedral virus 2]
MTSSNSLKIKLDVRTRDNTIIFYISSLYCKLVIAQDNSTIYIFDSEMNTLNELNVEDFDKLTLSDFNYNNCMYSLYREFLKLLVRL